MSWIEDDIAKVKKLRTRKDAIVQNCQQIYDDLWSELAARLEEGRGHNRRSSTNGSPSDRVILFEPNGPNLHVTLDRANSAIVVRINGGVHATFEVTADENNVVHLAYNKEPLNITEVARLILEPFLFPELHK